MEHPLLFYTFSAVSIVCAVGVVQSRSAVYSVLFLILAMCMTAGLFILLGAYLIAMIQVIVYAGAILVLFLFVVMLLDVHELQHTRREFRFTKVIAFVVAAAFGVLSIHVAGTVLLPASDRVMGGTAAVGLLIFSRYLLPFELTSLLLLAAVVSVVVLAKKETT